MGETGAKESEGLFNAACSFNYTCYSLFCVFLCGYFTCLCVLYMGRIHKGSGADKGFVIFSSS